MQVRFIDLRTDGDRQILCTNPLFDGADVDQCGPECLPFGWGVIEMDGVPIMEQEIDEFGPKPRWWPDDRDVHRHRSCHQGTVHGCESTLEHPKGLIHLIRGEGQSRSQANARRSRVEHVGALIVDGLANVVSSGRIWQGEGRQQALPTNIGDKAR